MNKLILTAECLFTLKNSKDITIYLSDWGLKVKIKVRINVYDDN